VLELSSYQIADLTQGPQVALLTNLFREHTDWHGSEDAYREDKLRLLGLPGVRSVVANGRDALLSAAARAASAEVTLYGVPEGWDTGQSGISLRGVQIAPAEDLPLRGEHNALNLCGALAALEVIGVRPALPEALAGFSALPHRLQTIWEHDGLTWVDDSISTTPESSIAALASFPGRSIILIVGGQDRGQDHRELARALAAAGAGVIGIPSTGPSLVVAARAAGVPDTRAVQASDLADAVARARACAQPGSVILLSPAAPSYDNYLNFEERGDRFSELASSPGAAPEGAAPCVTAEPPGR
jgi:UDP-N-acetylmuramoylalanine-D-glutamate ligase